MTFVMLSPVSLSFLLLVAHFYRANLWLLVGATLVLSALLALRQRWVPLMQQVALWLGALEWLRTLSMLVMERSAMGQPYLRLALILGAVAAFTALSGLVFRATRVRTFYKLESDLSE